MDVEKVSIKNSNWERAYANRFIVLTEDLNMFRLGTNASGRKINPSGNFSFTKIILFVWMSGI